MQSTNHVLSRLGDRATFGRRRRLRGLGSHRRVPARPHARRHACSRREDRLGGHAHTHDLTASDGSEHAVDSGFIVHNDRTYPGCASSSPSSRSRSGRPR